MVTNPLLVRPDMGAIVSRTDVQEGAGARFGLGLKVTFVEDDPFVSEELGDLGIPVTWNFQRRSSGKVIFVIVRTTRYVRVTIQGIPVVVDRAVCGIEGAEWRIVH